ncbi:UDP-N-acetylenolpyruvoylglucosamine reductase [Vibrio aerogenes CECT 7868]|uniref:UDP-N-acetylenolpyruvoylglucosamine reductase n=1 Tax=Vibrio aerogenes CECT 7868 TaxID=1216006 RepID=A0A1M5YSL6_9VIBR|nr:UDP-N-acetylmuramate dehydrogenase [Vibrio aerogenes]SHI15005.1 UDP-N-acetylenolpyruvoylglucosamine reductase [Vibrio aerogenes CECT 7868]
MQIHSNASLRAYHTFGIAQCCRFLVEVSSVDELVDVYRRPEWKNLPKMVLGQGSNVLFTTFFDGVVIINCLKGITISENSATYHLHVSAGEDWPDLVENTVRQNIAGLENLAMIPGCAGSAPIQNIGAYGIEFKDICEYVDYLCLESLTVHRLSKNECCFGYRDSVFKHHLYQKAVVVAIGLVVVKNRAPALHYGALRQLPEDAGAEAVFEHVCHIRQEKLPDPEVSGNAGSFFKNPVISHEDFELIKQRFPDIVSYPQEQGVKLAAGWLIEQCGLKGMKIGGAQVHPNQALVLVNDDNATAEDVIRLAAHVYSRVFETYGVSLEHEVRFIGATGEVYLSDLIKKECSG